MKTKLRIQYPLLFCIVIFLNSLLVAQEDKNISILKKTSVYEFTKGNDLDPVLVKEQTSTQFRCNDYRTTIPFSEFYNDNISIDEVKVLVDGNRRNAVIPKYDYYEIDGIFYSDEKICYFPLPLDKKGGISEVNIVKTYKDPKYLPNIFFSEPYDILQEEIKIIVPDWAKVIFKNFNFPPNQIKVSTSYDERNKCTVYSYQATDLKAMKKEQNAPGPTYQYPNILVMLKTAMPADKKITYFNQVTDLYNWYKSLLDKAKNDQNFIKIQALEITKAEKTDLEKVKAIYYWVQTNIRYVAFEDGIAGYKPQSAQDVYKKKYGDCKGMANLTKAMLISLGLDARICWLGTNHIAYDYSTPSLAVDNHAICAVNLNGHFYFLDATEKYIGFEEYAQRIQGRQIMIENGKTCLIEKLPEKTCDQNALSEKIILKLINNNLEGTVDLTYKGESKSNFVNGYQEIKKQNQQQVMELYLAKGLEGYKVQNLEMSNLLDWNSDLKLHYNVIHKDAVAEFGNEKYIEADLKKEFMDLIIDSGRIADYWFNQKYKIITQIEITLPDKYQPVSLPESLNITRSTYSFKAGYTYKNNILIYKKELIISDIRLPESMFDQWNKDVKKLKAFYLEQITIHK